MIVYIQRDLKLQKTVAKVSLKYAIKSYEEGQGMDDAEYG